MTMQNNNDLYEVEGMNPAEAAARAGADAVIRSEPTEIDSQTDYDVDIADDTDYNDVVGGVVNDDMSFSEAFGAARAEFGPGASFVWRGQVYGTFYHDEWKAMSPQQQHDWTVAALNDTSVDIPDAGIDKADGSDFADNDVDTDENQITIVGMNTVETDDGIINLATLDYDGETVFMVDLDNDNVYDYAIGDFDDSGMLLDSSDDMIDLSDMHLTVDDVANAMAYEEDDDTEGHIEDENLSDGYMDDFADDLDSHYDDVDGFDSDLFV